MKEHDLARAVRTRDGFRCTECDMTEAEHYHRFGDQLSVAVIDGSDLSPVVEGFQALCIPCLRRHIAMPEEWESLSA